jgi:hypothetical protein
MYLFVVVFQETARLILWLFNFIFSTAWGFHVECQVRLKDSYWAYCWRERNFSVKSCGLFQDITTTFVSRDGKKNYNGLMIVSKGTESYPYINLLENNSRLKITAFRIVTSCSLVEIYWFVGRTCALIFYLADEGTGFSETSIPLFKLHEVRSHMTVIFIFTAVRI